MANYHIGLDFGTSQTKVCLLNKDTNIREFIKFENEKYFLPSLIVKKADNTFSYGKENEKGIKYRYFKMAAAEDDELIQITNEDENGNLKDGKLINDFRKYSTNYEIKPEILIVLYLTYTFLFIKEQKKNQNPQNVGGLLGRLTSGVKLKENTYSINMGIPTEWNNPNHIKRKIKFQSLLISSIKLANQFGSLEDFLSKKYEVLLDKISKINKNHSLYLEDKNELEKAEIIKNWLNEYKLSVFPESAAGVNYLLKTGRLANGSYATLDVGAGTSDIAMFQVRNNELIKYYCSESLSLASNDYYREYATLLFNNDNNVTFEQIKEVEYIIRNNISINVDFCRNALRKTKGFRDRRGLEFLLWKTLYKQYYKPFRNNVGNILDELNNKPVIIFGGGANIHGLCNDYYCFYQGNNDYGHHDKNFVATPITNFVIQVDILNENEISGYINLLILAMGLTYGNHIDGNQIDDGIPFIVPQEDFQLINQNTINSDRYFYYDLQDAVYK